MAVTASVRLLVLTALVGLAGAALSARTTEPAGNQAAPEPGNSLVGLAVLIAIAVPALVLIVVAALRFRRASRAAPRPTPPAARRWLGVIVLLGLLALMVGGTVLVATLSRHEPAGPAPAPGTATPTPRAPAPAAAGQDWGWLIAGVAALLVLLVLAAIAYRRTPARPVRESPEPGLRCAVERALAAVTEPAADARAAIIGCYATMEGALTAVPGLAPRVADSPSEVLQRAHRAGAVRSAAAWRLVELFDEARFSRHRMTDPDRAAAESSLRVILDELRSPT